MWLDFVMVFALARQWLDDEKVPVLARLSDRRLLVLPWLVLQLLDDELDQQWLDALMADGLAQWWLGYVMDDELVSLSPESALVLVLAHQYQFHLVLVWPSVCALAAMFHAYNPMNQPPNHHILPILAG